jgi:hypothetical protein
MGITEVRSPWSSTSRSDSAPEEGPQMAGTVIRHSSEPSPPLRTAPVDQVPSSGPLPPSTDNEGEQAFSPLPPLEEEPQAAADNVDPSGSGEPLGSCNPQHLREFEQLFGQRVFGPKSPALLLGLSGQTNRD